MTGSPSHSAVDPVRGRQVRLAVMGVVMTAVSIANVNRMRGPGAKFIPVAALPMSAAAPAQIMHAKTGGTRQERPCRGRRGDRAPSG